MTIKHLIISGGAIGGLIQYGALYKFLDKQFIKFDDIESAHCVSIGSLLSVIFMLQIEKDLFDNYILNRPFDRMYEITPEIIFSLPLSNGCFDPCEKIGEFIKPFLTFSGLSLDTTLKEFYDMTKKDLYIYTCELNSMTLEILHHTTQPDLKLVSALSMSCAIPLLFKPISYENKYYIDGGIVNNYPLNIMIENHNIDLDTILGIRFHREDYDFSTHLSKDLSTFSIVSHIIYKSWLKINDEKNKAKIKNEIILHYPESLRGNPYKDIYNLLKNSNEKQKLIIEGELCADLFMEYKQSSSESELIQET